MTRQIGPERHRGFGVERHVDLAQLIESVDVAIDAAQRLFLVRVGEVDPKQLLPAVQRFLRDSEGLVLSLLTRKCRGGEPGCHSSRHGLQKTPALEERQPHLWIIRVLHRTSPHTTPGLSRVSSSV